MAYPNNDGMFILDTDASATGIGAVLSQMQWDAETEREVEKPVAFASRSLTKTQRRYCTTRRELLAVVSFVRHFRHFLLGRKFLIRTDHSSLRWIMSFREPTDQMARWLEILSQFDFVIQHRAGNKHANADAMSRVPCDPDECSCYDNKSIIEELPCGGCNTCRRRHQEWSDFFEEDDVVPLSAKRVRRAELASGDRGGHPQHHCREDEKCNEDIRPPRNGLPQLGKLLMVILAVSISVICGMVSAFHKVWKCGSSYVNMCFAVAVNCVLGVGRIVDARLRSFGGGWRPTPLVVGIKRASKDVRQRRHATSPHATQTKTVGDEDVPCVPETDADAGASRAGQHGVIFDSYSREDLIQMQKDDPDIGIVVQWLVQSSERPDRSMVHDKSPAVRNLWLSWKQLTMIDGVVYKRYMINHSLTSSLQLVVPAKLRTFVMKTSHASIMSGHLGFKKTLSKLKRSFYWHRMKETVRQFVASCATCGARKRPNPKPKAPLGDYNVGAPMDRVALDIMGPFPESNCGNRYVLVVGDTFTKWIEAYAIPDQTAKTVADKLVHEFISRFGTPLELHSDQGRTFESSLFKDVCKLLEIHKTRTTPYHPSSNGMIERFNQTLANMISSFVDTNQLNWDENLNLLTSAYRSCQHESTGFSPNFLMLGRELRTPVEFALGVEPPLGENENIGEYATNLSETMAESARLVREHLNAAVQRQKKNHDVRVSHNNYNVGDYVYYLDSTKSKGLSPKLKLAWKGPCVVTKKLSDLIFEIRPQQRGKAKILHHDRLKPYSSPDVPNWVSSLAQSLKLKQTRHTQKQAATQTTPQGHSEKGDTPIPELRRSKRKVIPPDRFSS